MIDYTKKCYISKIINDSKEISKIRRTKIIKMIAFHNPLCASLTNLPF